MGGSHRPCAAGGLPVGIEQDLAWFVDPSGKGRLVVSHTSKTNGSEPTLKDYFFEHVRPVVERALRENQRSTWPLIILHFDVKDNRPELHHAVWELLGEYQDWITTAENTSDPSVLAPLDPKPLLVLTEDNDAQEQVFFKQVPAGARLRLFGSAHTAKLGRDRPRKERTPRHTSAGSAACGEADQLSPLVEQLVVGVEEGGQQRRGRLDRLRRPAPSRLGGPQLTGLAFGCGFIRWTGLARKRITAGTKATTSDRAGRPDPLESGLSAGVDLIATDQYEDLAPLMH
jgi:hypothetical protein